MFERFNSLNFFNIKYNIWFYVDFSNYQISIVKYNFFLQGKKFFNNFSNIDEGEVSDEDEVVDVSNEFVKFFKKDSGYKIKFSQEFLVCVGFKVVGFKGVEEFINLSKKIL